MEVPGVQSQSLASLPRLDFFAPELWRGERLEQEVRSQSALPVDTYTPGQWKADYLLRDQPAYKATLDGKPVSAYDPQGFFKQLGIDDSRSSGRTDTQHFAAFRLTGYKPDPEYFPGPKWLATPVQSGLLKLARVSPASIVSLSALATKTVIRRLEKPDTLDPHPFGQESDIDKGEKSSLSPQQYYASQLRALNPRQFTWEEPVHTGSIKGNPERKETFGTYDVALKLGFSDRAARNISIEDFAVDTDKTHYLDAQGRPRVTHSGTGGASGDLHWHYNRSPEGAEDSRISATKIHLDRAVGFARQGYYQAAERELGVGLHSLQDMFAHGQISPIGHLLLGEFPDFVWWNPQGMFETARATESYLKLYLQKLELSPPDNKLKPQAFQTLGQTLGTERVPAALAPKWTAIGAIIGGDAPLAQQLAAAEILARCPQPMLERLHAQGLRLYLGQPGTLPTQLGFGQDLDGDGRVTPGKWVDLDGDTQRQPLEREDGIADGRCWNQQQAAYHADLNLIWLSAGLLANPQDFEAKLQHELLHALDFALEKDPELGKQWPAYVQKLYDQARASGKIGFDSSDPHEYFVQHSLAQGQSVGNLRPAIAVITLDQVKGPLKLKP